MQYFFSGVKTRAQLETLSSATTLPLVLGNPGADVVNLEYLATQRVKICLQGHQPVLAAVQAVYASLKALKDGLPPAELKGLPLREADDSWSPAVTNTQK